MPSADVTDNLKKDAHSDDQSRHEQLQKEVSDAQNQNPDSKTKETACKTKELVSSGLLPSISIAGNNEGAGDVVGGMLNGSNTKNADGSTLDGNGLIVAKTYPDGGTRIFDRDDKGR